MQLCSAKMTQKVQKLHSFKCLLKKVKKPLFIQVIQIVTFGFETMVVSGQFVTLKDICSLIFFDKKIHCVEC